MVRTYNNLTLVLKPPSSHTLSHNSHLSPLTSKRNWQTSAVLFLVWFSVACMRLYNPLCWLVRRFVGWSLFAFSASLAFLSSPAQMLELDFFLTAPAHPHSTLVAMNPALFFLRLTLIEELVFLTINTHCRKGNLCLTAIFYVCLFFFFAEKNRIFLKSGKLIM